MYDTNKWMLWVVKLVVTAFNIPDTWYAFDRVFTKTERPDTLKVFTIFMAIFAIDIVFLWVLDVLEKNLHPVKKLPYALAAVLFACFSVWIGFRSEGDILAFVPRIGLLMVVFIYLTAFGVDIYDFYNSREQVEKRMNDAKVNKLRKVDKAAYTAVLENSHQMFEDRHLKKLKDQFGIKEEPVYLPERSGPPVQQSFFQPCEELPEYIFETEQGYGWESPYTGEEFYTTSTGKPYTEHGAKIALSRHEKEYKQNGHAL